VIDRVDYSHFHGGVGEIVGNKVLLKDGGTDAATWLGSRELYMISREKASELEEID